MQRVTRRAHLAMALTWLAMSGDGAFAHGPTRQKVVEKISINAPADAVWARLRDFDALKDWHPAVAASPADKGNTVGSLRTISIKGGGEILETLEAYSDEQKRYSYRAKDGGALPVSNYTSTIQVIGDGAASVVEWRGAFYRGHPGNEPPPEKNDDAAVKAVTQVYRSGLASLKKVIEGQ